MGSQRPSPTSSVAVPFRAKARGSHSSTRSGTPFYFTSDTHISGRESAGTFLSPLIWIAIVLPWAFSINRAFFRRAVDDVDKPDRRFLELAPRLEDLSAERLFPCWTGFCLRIL